MPASINFDKLDPATQSRLRGNPKFSSALPTPDTSPGTPPRGPRGARPVDLERSRLATLHAASGASEASTPSPDLAAASTTLSDYRAKARAEGRGQIAPPPPAAPGLNPLLHPVQFMRNADPKQVASVGLSAMRTTDALSRLAAPGGMRHILPFAFNLHQTPYGTLAAAADAMSNRDDEH